VSESATRARRLGMHKKKTPDVRPGTANKFTHAHVADPVLLDFLAQESAPPDATLRLGIVKLALSKIAYLRGHARLSCVFHYGDEDAVKALVLVASHIREQALEWLLEDDAPNYKRALKLLATVVTDQPQVNEYPTFRCALRDEIMLRIIETAGDVLDWDDESDRAYIKDAWPVLADEFEWEQEGGDDPWSRLHRRDPCNDRPAGPATTAELLDLEHDDKRYLPPWKKMRRST
jgi:hypothetical protein